MASMRGMNRLLRLRKVEEELSRLELEAAVTAERRIEEAADAVRERHAMARRGFAAAVQRGDAVERLGELVGMEAAAVARAGLEPRKQRAHTETERLRAEFLLRRTGRRQVETLNDRALHEAASRELRRAQQGLDDWYVHRRSGKPAAGRLVPTEAWGRTLDQASAADKPGASENCNGNNDGVIL